MKIHEYQATQLFQKCGLPVAEGKVAAEAEDAKAIAETLGYPVVLKAQVLTGGRGKAGGVKVAKTEKELLRYFRQIKDLKIKGYPVEKILVVGALNIKQEYYFAATVDAAKGDIVLIVSFAGGVDIEEVARKTPEKIHKFYLNGEHGIDLDRWPEFVRKIFEGPSDQEKALKIANSLLRVFYEYDCSLAEINPLVVDGCGIWRAADAKVNIDDNALFRHPDLQGLRDMDYEDGDELEAKECNLSFVKLDGNVGCIVNGAGLAMATMDIIKILGGDPANFLDVGGSSNPEKVLNALRIILRNKDVKSILINIFGGITRCDDIAKGILEARSRLEFNVPLVIRLTGTNEDEAKEILQKENMEIYTSMREAVQKAVELAR